MSKQVYQGYSYHYDACYRMIWHCAQQMTYPDFYQAYYQAGNEQVAIADKH